MNDELLSEISKKLNVLIAVSVRPLMDDKDFAVKSGRKSIGNVVRYLADLGLNAKDIAQIVGSPVSSVRTLLTPKRRK